MVNLGVATVSQGSAPVTQWISSPGADFRHERSVGLRQHGLNQSWVDVLRV